jgi:hypothetical protein
VGDVIVGVSCGVVGAVVGYVDGGGLGEWLVVVGERVGVCVPPPFVPLDRWSSSAGREEGFEEGAPGGAAGADVEVCGEPGSQPYGSVKASAATAPSSASNASTSTGRVRRRCGRLTAVARGGVV